MPRTTITPENMVGGGDDRFPSLKLKLGEVARIWLPPEPGTQSHQPWREWVHSVEAPVIEHGVAKKETRTRERDQTTYEVYATSFVNNPICLGDFGKLAERGVDPDNCPACDAAQRMGHKDFKPKVRYASVCVKFALKQGTIDPAAPFSAAVLIWAYPGTRAKILSELFKNEGRDLCMFDIALGPCQPPENYQKYDIRALGSRTPAWKESPPTHAYNQPGGYVAELLRTEGNLPTEDQLQLACGKPTERSYMEEDIRRVEPMWRIAKGEAPGPAGTTGAEFGGAALGAGLQDLINSAGTPPGAIPAPPPPAQAQAAAEADLLGAAQHLAGNGQIPQATADELGALLGGDPTPGAPPAATTSPGPVTAPAPAGEDLFPTAEPAPAPQGETVSFEDLLGGP